MVDLLKRLQAALADRYAVESEIGRGGMATVYLAEDLRHHRKVAIKVLHPELSVTLAAERFLSEIQIAAGLNHPHILALFDSGEADGLLYYVMPHVPGESLRHRLEREGQLPVEEAVRIAVEVADGLQYAHEQGVIHRDVKPGNILLSSRHAVITDFGIARAITVAQGARVTSTGLGVGTPLYASPEQATGAETLDGRTDVYSLGCVLYEMLSGEVPLAASTPNAVQARRLTETPGPIHSLRDTVPPLLDQVIAKALARLPADRWDSAEKFGQALVTATMDATPVARLDLMTTPGLEAIAAGSAKRKRLRWAIGATVVAVAAVGAWLVVPRLVVLTTGVDRAADPAPAPVETRLELQGTFGFDLQFGPGSYAISPDGELLAYCSWEEAESVWRLWLANLSNPERPHEVLASGATICRWVRWTPSGDRVLFRADQEGRIAYYAASRHGGQLEPFTECPANNDSYPFDSYLVHLSPDGSRRTFWNSNRKDFRILPAGSCDLGSADSIVVRGDLPYQFPVAWVARGDRMLLSEGDGRTSGQLTLIGLDGRDQRTLATDAGAWPFWWSRDGRELWYRRTGPWGNSPDWERGPVQAMRLKLSASGVPEGEPSLVPHFRDHPVDWFSVSDDGNRAVVARETNQYRALLVTPDSEDGSAVLEQITDVIRGETWYPFVFARGSAALHGIDMSPDGRWILLSREVPGGSDLFKVPVEGGEPVRLTRSGLAYGGIWSPDGRFVAYPAPERDSVRLQFASADGLSSGPVIGADPGLPFFPSWGQDRLVYDRPDFELESLTDLVIEYGQHTYIGWQPVEESAGGEPPTATFVVRAERRPLVSAEKIAGWASGLKTQADSSRTLVGGMIFPYVSPDGSRVLFWWNHFIGPEPLGSWWWIATGAEPELTPFAAENYLAEKPLGWTRDGTGLYWQVGRALYLWPLSGERRRVLTLPEGRISCKPRPDMDTPAFLCVQDESYVELFLVENLDPDAS